MRNLAVIFGGKSAEHQVSLQSAKNVLTAINQKKYRIFPIAISQKGEWFLLGSKQTFINSDNPKKIALPKSKNLVTFLVNGKSQLYNLKKKKIEAKIDLAFPILHGPFGEDGSIQGLLRLAGIPFVGADVLGSAVGMDKEIMKRLLIQAGLPVGKFIVLNKNQKPPSYIKLKNSLGAPFFIKPANMGSSVGISKVKNQKELSGAIRLARKYDDKIILEKNIQGREIECSILGNQNPKASKLGEIVNKSDFYSYSAKYLDKNASELEIPAKLSQEKQKKIQNLAIKTFKTLECKDYARVDFFIKKNGKILVNEINTIPGFTNISMYPKLWQKSGLPYKKLINNLLDLALANK